MNTAFSSMDSLITGYKKFKSEYFTKNNVYSELVKYGQHPQALVISCCDSRVDPATITGCDPGTLFVVRNVANLVPPFNSDPQHHSTSAALEFGVTGLNVSNIIILGHSHCGGIRALMETTDEKKKDSNFIGAWMDIAMPAKKAVLLNHRHCSFDEQAHYCEKESLLISLKNLETFPWIKEKIAFKKLFLHAWYFNLEAGIIETYHSATHSFIPLEETPV